MEEDFLRSMGEPKRKHVGTEDECLESEGKEKKVSLLKGTQQLDALMSINQVSVEVAGNPAGTNEFVKLELPGVWEPSNN